MCHHCLRVRYCRVLDHTIRHTMMSQSQVSELVSCSQEESMVSSIATEEILDSISYRATIPASNPVICVHRGYDVHRDFKTQQKKLKVPYTMKG